MSRAMKVKTIENPEVPGLESVLPPPPPPCSFSVANNAGTEENKRAATDPETSMADDDSDRSETHPEDDARENISGPTGNLPSQFPMRVIPEFSESPQRSYFVQPAVDQVSAGEQPWWISMNSDTAAVFPQATSWMDGNSGWPGPGQKSTLPDHNSKNKILKRKSECIDPAQDAERIANAQKELSALMKPLKCDLCNAIMNSTLQAKLHYDGKPHQKKVSMFLNQSVKKPKLDDGQVTSTTNNPDWNTHCEVCKIWFTSQIDANQHNAGKKHIRATTGAAKQKTIKPRAPPVPIDPTGRFGIGVPFAVEAPPVLEAPPLPIIPPVASPVVSPVNTYQTAAWPFPTFRCELCGVTTNRPEQLETHKRGARHIKMLKMSGLPNPDIDEVSDNLTQPVPSSIDYSIHRTPSGQYYCAPCNRSFPSENSFAQHLDSKKHKGRVNPKQASPPIVVSKISNKTSK